MPFPSVPTWLRHLLYPQLVSRVGKRLSMATMNGTALPATQGARILDSALGDPAEAGGREAPRPDPEVLARPKRRTYTGEYKHQVLAEAEAARGGEIGAVLRRPGVY